MDRNVEMVGAIAFATLAKQASLEDWAKAVAGSYDDCALAQITVKVPQSVAEFIRGSYEDSGADEGFVTEVLAHVFSTLLFLGYAKAKGTNVTTIQVSKN